METLQLFLSILLLLLLLLSTSSLAQNRPKCSVRDQGSTLEVLHIYSPCSPFRPSAPSLSWEESILQMQQKDQARLQFLSSLVAGKSVVPVASGRQIVQSPTYILRAKIGTPPQTLLMAMDTSNDAAWVPCSGCVGCPSSTAFASAKPTDYENGACNSPQCSQVHLSPTYPHGNVNFASH